MYINREYLAKIPRPRLEQPRSEDAGVGPDFDGDVRVADAALHGVDDEVRVELRVDRVLVEDGGDDGEGDQRLVQHPHVARHEHGGEVRHAAQGHDRLHDLEGSESSLVVQAHAS